MISTNRTFLFAVAATCLIATTDARGQFISTKVFTGMLTRAHEVPSVVLQPDCTLTGFFRPRFTFSKMSRAEAVQTNGLGLEL
jgi:hypothetical protein